MENKKIQKEIEHERYQILHQVEDWLEGPLLILGIIWLILLVVELIWKLNPFLETLAVAIWIIFIFDFLLRLFLAPGKIQYIKTNWLNAISLIVPALRVFSFIRVLRVLQAARAARGLQLLKVLGSLNRGLRALRNNLGRRGVIYVFLLTIIVVLVGAAGMYAFENNEPGGKGFTSYADALWWTSMIITTIGSEAWPKTMEGRMLGFLISLYACGVFGYITATLATFFIGREAENDDAEIAGAKAIEELRKEIRLLREEIKNIK